MCVAAAGHVPGLLQQGHKALSELQDRGAHLW